MTDRFSLARFRALVAKEFIQMLRDRLTFAMVAAVPVAQLLLFGYAINTDPKHLPTALVVTDDSTWARSLVRTLETSEYFDVVLPSATVAEADAALQRGAVQFVLTIPADFGRDLVRGARPVVLLEADASDPVATGTALAAVDEIARRALRYDLVGALAPLRPGDPPFELRVHRRYNPEGATEYNVVPGLIGTILQMTMVMMTAIAVTRERERGTMETLLATPARPLEIMLGKMAPFIAVGAVQVTIIVLFARLLFDVPLEGNLALLGLALLLFIAVNLAIGFTFSTIAENQLQAMQMTFFFFLPSILLSGFMFPFRGMPGWAQALGEALPMTHVLRAVRGVMLKGAEFAAIAPTLWTLAGIFAIVAAIAVMRFRQTLD